MRKITKRSAAVVTAVVVAVGGGAAAWAAWSVSQSSTAEATTGSAVPVTVESSTIVGGLVPGSQASVKVGLRNTNAFAVSVNNVRITGISTTKSGCANSNFQFTNPTSFTAVPLANAGVAGDTTEVTLENAVRLRANPDNACQAATITVAYTVDAASAA
jgi:hypothetical protein